MKRWVLNEKKGFTIVELLIVVVVIAILASITIVAFNGIQARARDARRDGDVRQLRIALEQYRMENGIFPPTPTDNIGVNVSTLSTSLNPYLPVIPNDPQAGRVYQYVRGADSSQSYAIHIRYETKPVCKTGENVSAGWWGTAVPIC